MYRIIFYCTYLFVMAPDFVLLSLRSFIATSATRKTISDRQTDLNSSERLIQSLPKVKKKIVKHLRWFFSFIN